MLNKLGVAEVDVAGKRVLIRYLALGMAVW